MADRLIELAVYIWLGGIVVFMLIDRATTDSEPKDGASIFWPVGIFVLLPIFLVLRWRARSTHSQGDSE